MIINLIKANQILLEREEQKLAQLTYKINQFGVKHYGSKFQGEINKNTKASMEIMLDPNIPKMKEFTMNEKIVMNVSQSQKLFF